MPECEVIRFHSETDFILENKAACKDWLLRVVKGFSRQVKDLSYVFLDDHTLADMNRQYLGHDSFTDILTFDLSEDDNGIVADVYISIDRVQDNARSLQVEMRDELHRVMVHGLLHLLGYTDATAGEKKEMRSQEDYWLNLRGF